MKKKLLSVVLAGARTFSLAGCGGGSTPTPAAPTTAARMPMKELPATFWKAM